MSCFHVSAQLRVCSSRALSRLRALFHVGAWCSDPATHVLSFGFGHSRSTFCLFVRVCGLKFAILFCPRVFCCVARSLCIVMLLFFFFFFLMTFEFENTGRHRDCHGAQSIRKELLERQANEKKSRHKKLELMKDTKEQQTRLLHYTKQL